MRVRVISQTPGRLRVHLPDWAGDGPDRIEARLLGVPGVEAVQAKALTGNVLVRFSPRVGDAQTILATLHQPPVPQAGDGQHPVPSTSPWLRVGIRGLLGHAVVDSLWFGAGFLGQSVGLPLAALGPLHVLLDVVVWGAAFASVGDTSPQPSRGA